MTTCIYDQTKNGIARVMIHDHGQARSIGRYQIQRIMRLPNGKTKVTYGYRHQLPAAKRHAYDWLEAREAMFREANTEVRQPETKPTTQADQ